MPKSRLSRRIAMLEERLGVRLIQRSTRSFTVTELGQAYYTRCRAMLVEADAAQDLIAATQSEPCGLVRIACPIDLLHAHVGGGCWSPSPWPIPASRCSSSGSTGRWIWSRRVGHGAQGATTAPGGQRSRHAGAGLCDPVSGGKPGPCRVTRHAPGPADLLSWPSLGHGASLEGHHWTLLGPNGARVKQHHSPRFATTDMQTLRQGAIDGLGVVQLPTMMMDEPLADGRLVRLLPDWAPRQEVIHAVFPSRRGLLPAIRALIDHLVEGFSPWGRQVRRPAMICAWPFPGVPTCKRPELGSGLSFFPSRGGETDTGSILRRAF